MPPVLIIGLDGGSFDLIRPWVAQGKLSNIARLMNSGTTGNLKSTVPPMTFPAWNAFMTGKNPGKHGVFDFMERKRGTFNLEIKNAGHRKCDTIWKIASAADRRCAVIGVPVTYPPEEINGVMISGFDAPFLDERIMYPRELFHELNEKVGEYIVSAQFSRELKEGNIEKALDALLTAVDRKAETAKYLMKKGPWDLFMIVFGETDAVMHHFWKYHDPHSPQRVGDEEVNVDPIYEIYKRIDEHIGDLLNLSGEDATVIVMSDHGAGGAGDKVVYINRFLEQNGLLTFQHDSSRKYFSKTLDTLKFFIRTVLPAKWLKQLLYNPEGMGLKWEAKLRFSSIDWSRTLVYAEETPYYPNLRVNLKGREPEGTVEKDDYLSVINKTIEVLNNWKDPESGKKVVTKAYIKEDIYRGDYIENSPDILISWNYTEGYSYLFRPSFTAKTRESIEKLSRQEMKKMPDFMLKRSGSHREEGVFIIQGKGIKPGTPVDKVELIDLAPTILHIMGIPIPLDLDGRVLQECFADDRAEQPRFQSTSLSEHVPDYAYTAEEERVIEERLKGLGYL